MEDENNKSIAVITARGGSKRIPRKNIKEFCGKPVIAYSIEAALASGIFDEVMVSTDDEEIKGIALEYGAKVPFLRSPENSNDTAATVDVLEEVLNEYKKRGFSYRYLCCLYPTAPFITAAKLRDGMKQMIEQEADSLIPVVAFSFPPQRCFAVKDDWLKFKWEEHEFTRSQDLEKLYHDCGQYYCINVLRFLQTRRIVMDKTLPFFTDELEVQDIDNETDWKLAELKYRLLKEQSHG